MATLPPTRQAVFQLSKLGVALMFGGLLLTPALSADSVRVGAYDFNYLSAGDAAARPVQVFDDGRNTYLQFRPGMVVPAIFSSKGGDSPQLVVPVQEGPYVKVPEVYGRLVLQVGRAQAHVVRGDGLRFDAAQLTVNTPSGRQPYVAGTPYPAGAHLVASLAPVPLTATGAPAIVDDMLERNSYATPRKGDNLTWEKQAEASREERDVWFSAGSAVLTQDARRALAAVVKAMPAGAQATVIGRDDESFKEGLDSARTRAIVQALVRAGLPMERIIKRQGAAGKQSGKRWASTLVIDGGAQQAASQGTRRNAAVVANLQALVREGVLRLEQAESIARAHGFSVGAGPNQQPTAAANPAAATPAAAYAAATPAATSLGGPDVRGAGASSAPLAKQWDMRLTDGNLQQMLKRWAVDAGWVVVWNDAPVIDVTGDMKLPSSDFLTAAGLVVRRAQELGYRITASAYSNRTLVLGQGK